MENTTPEINGQADIETKSEIETKFEIENPKPEILTMADMAAQGKEPEILFWVGCAGSFDERAQKITRDICKILNHVGISFAVLGTEESCTGDPAKRAGNEFLFQMQAMTNIQVLNGYNIKKIVTGCPHCFNTIKNEYPGLGGSYEVIHHTQLIQQLIDDGKLKAEGGESFKGKKITYHDPCYLGRGNNVYEAPRRALEILDTELVEMKRCKSNGLCCGAGGAQMFKEAEPGKKEINDERIDEAIITNATIVAAACPFCMTMLTDGVKHRDKEEEIKVLDIAEITVRANGL
nr:Fe-S oxidoreductase [Mucilaginibacter sp. X5P1]